MFFLNRNLSRKAYFNFIHSSLAYLCLKINYLALEPPSSAVMRQTFPSKKCQANNILTKRTGEEQLT